MTKQEGNFDSLSNGEPFLFPLFESSDPKFKQQCKILWHCYQFYQHIENSSFDFSASSEEDIAGMSHKLNTLIDIHRLLGRRVITGYLPDQQQQDLAVLLDEQLDKFQTLCNFGKPITREMPELPDDKQIRMFLHDMANHMSLMTQAFMVPRTNAQKLFNQGLGYLHTAIRKAYTQIGKEILPLESSQVLLEDFDKELIDIFWPLERNDKRYKLVQDKTFVRDHAGVTFLADPVDLSGYLVNIVQNLQRAYDERDKRNPTAIHADRVLRVNYQIEEGWLKAIYEDDAIGFDKVLLDEGRFIKGRSTLGGQGLGMFDYQNRFEKLGIRMELDNHRNGARLIVFFPIKAGET